MTREYSVEQIEPDLYRIEIIAYGHLGVSYLVKNVQAINDFWYKNFFDWQHYNHPDPPLGNAWSAAIQEILDNPRIF